MQSIPLNGLQPRSSPDLARGATRTIQIAVIIPVRDTPPELLEEAVSSVTSQPNIPEIGLSVIVVDDGSREEATRAQLGRLREKPRVTVIPNTRTAGVSGARNTGIAAARADWICFLDSDDVWTPNALSAFWEIVQREPEAGFVSGDTGIWERDGSIRHWNTGNPRSGALARRLKLAATSDDYVQVHDPVDVILRHQIFPTTGASLIHRRVLDEARGFREDLSRGEDTDLWLRVARIQTLFLSPKMVLKYRLHEQSTTSGKRRGVGEQQYLPTYLKDRGWRPWRGAIRYRLAKTHAMSVWWFRDRREFRRATRHAVLAVRYQPGNPRNWRLLVGTVLSAIRYRTRYGR